MKCSMFPSKKIVGVLGLSMILSACGDGKVINVVEATYGWSCKNAVVQPPFRNEVAAGNATAEVSAACNGKESTCLYTINVDKLGDPAAGCTKDLSAKFKCGKSGQIRNVLLPNPHEKGLTLSCN